jgi:hypothetical protein
VQRPTLPRDLRQIKELLHTSVTQYISSLRPNLSGPYRIVARAYAALDKIPPGHLEGFFAGFAYADNDFDFTLLLSETFVEERISGTSTGACLLHRPAHVLSDVFETAKNDAQCKRIMLAAWGRTSYFSLLRLSSAKVTVVEGAKMGAGVEVLLKSVPLTAFPNIFAPAHKTDSLRAILPQIQNQSTFKPDLLGIITNKVRRARIYRLPA